MGWTRAYWLCLHAPSLACFGSKGRVRPAHRLHVGTQGLAESGTGVPQRQSARLRIVGDGRGTALAHVVRQHVDVPAVGAFDHLGTAVVAARAAGVAHGNSLSRARRPQRALLRRHRARIDDPRRNRRTRLPISAARRAMSSNGPYSMQKAWQWCTQAGSSPSATRSAHRLHSLVGMGWYIHSTFLSSPGSLKGLTSVTLMPHSPSPSPR